MVSATSIAPLPSLAQTDAESDSSPEGVASVTDARRLLETELADPKYEKTLPQEDTYFRRLMNAITKFFTNVINSILSWVATLASHTNTAIALAVVIALGVVTLYLVFKGLLPRFLESGGSGSPSTGLSGAGYSEEDARKALESGDIGRAFRIVFVLLAGILRGGIGVHRETALTNREIAYATARVLPARRDPLVGAARTADRWFYADSPPSRQEGERACSLLLEALALLSHPPADDAGRSP